MITTKSYPVLCYYDLLCFVINSQSSVLLISETKKSVWLNFKQNLFCQCDKTNYYCQTLNCALKMALRIAFLISSYSGCSNSEIPNNKASLFNFCLSLKFFFVALRASWVSNNWPLTMESILWLKLFPGMLRWPSWSILLLPRFSSITWWRDCRRWNERSKMFFS